MPFYGCVVRIKGKNINKTFTKKLIHGGQLMNNFPYTKIITDFIISKVFMISHKTILYIKKIDSGIWENVLLVYGKANWKVKLLLCNVFPP